MIRSDVGPVRRFLIVWLPLLLVVAFVAAILLNPLK
jgi:hypothetical protein